MSYRRGGRARLLAFAITALTAAAGLAAPAALGSAAGAATTTLCNSQTAAVGGRSYVVQNNEWNSSAAECVTTDGNADFSVANSAISNATDGAPGGYPSIYQGCHWGNCSSGGLAATPVQASNLGTAKVTTSWSTTQTAGGAYDVAYDIWFNQTATTTGQPNCMELMVWLNHNGSVQPFGSEVATNVSIAGRTYNVWEGSQSTWDTVSYAMTTGTTSVSNLDVGKLAQDAIGRGYLPSSCWLIDVEAGFELWQGGAGLATKSFSVNTSTGSGSGGGGCTATYAIVNSWSGGFQARVTVTAGTSGLSGWSVGWTFPGNQKIIGVWNASFRQSGQGVTAGNVSYNGTLAARASTTFGFNASYTGANAAPASLSCT